MQLSPQFEKALIYATRIHGGQLRKKTRIPYIAHIISVCAILMDYRKEGERLWSRFNGGKQGALWYYRALVNAFTGKSRELSGLVQELNRTLTQLEFLSNNGAQVKQPPATNEAAT